ncbi:MAG: folate-binding protein, partial [Actinobacteria bacterium]|nr:folate-binding protein [Actinomycetota bacterium]
LAKGQAWADLSHRGIIKISGRDRLSWLHSLTTQHLEKLEPGIWSEALILDPKGHLEYQFYLVDDSEATYLHLDQVSLAPLLEYLEKMKFMLDVAVSNVSDSYAILKAPGLSDEIGGPYALLPRSELEATSKAFNEVATQVGIWALEAERIAMGRARIGLDSDHKSIPNELGLLNKAVHMNKGCYRGQETVAKVFNLGHPPRRLVLLHLDGSSVDIPNSKDPITLDGKVIGYIGSVARHHELGPIGLGVIKRMTPADAILDVNGISASQEILVAIE